MALGLLLLRLALGLTMAAHGVQKLFGWFGGYGLKGTGQFFEKLGFVPGYRSALFAALAETLGGLFLAVGLLTPVGALLSFSVMIVAGVGVHLSKGFFLQGGGYEYNLVLGVGSLALAFTGAGALSADALLNLDFGPYAGWGALVLGIVGAALQLATRKQPDAAKS